jgi:hypothetical protein
MQRKKLIKRRKSRLRAKIKARRILLLLLVVVVLIKVNQITQLLKLKVINQKMMRRMIQTKYSICQGKSSKLQMM